MAHQAASVGGQTQAFITSSIPTRRSPIALPGLVSNINILSAPAFPNWQSEYESALLETDKSVLFTRVEVAAILTRRDALEHDSSSPTERGAIEEALARLRVLKRDRLHFGDTEQ
jgi:hypothetical protein